jgi:hypothetical protein
VGRRLVGGFCSRRRGDRHRHAREQEGGDGDAWLKAGGAVELIHRKLSS